MNIDDDYLTIIMNNLPRILSLFDSEKFSKTYGIGDRNYWAWAQIDYPNGTFQGFANGLSKLYKAKLLDNFFTQSSYIEFIGSIFEGTSKLQNKNGSLNEAFPNEQSWCVTSLVAFDLITALENFDCLESEDKKKKLKIIEPMLEYMKLNQENHAFISNHLVTAAAAFLKWHDLTGDTKYESGAEKIIDAVINSGASEGWFGEYGGFDAGYQTISTQYLAEIQNIRPNWGIGNELNKSVEFISNFLNPDGSFGGMIGSRQTNFFYPGGFHLLSKNNILAGKISNSAKNRIMLNQIVNLNSIDIGNLIPLFNSYCTAAINPVDTEIGYLDANKNCRKVFQHSGIIIDIGENHKTIVSLRNGGIVQHYLEDQERTIDCGVIIKNKKNKLGTTQHFIKDLDYSIENSIIKLNSTIHQFSRELPTPVKFAIIRILAVTLFKNKRMLKIFKKLIVKRLITNQKNLKIKYTREIHLGENLQVNNLIELNQGEIILSNSTKFSPFHMASRGYWQIGNFNHDR
jgi:hypothetical protein